MEKFNEFETKIWLLRTLADSINGMADTLTEKFKVSQISEKQNVVVPTEKVLTMEEVRAVLAKKAKEGFTEEIRTLIHKYGAEKLSGIDPANYKRLLADVMTIGTLEKPTEIIE